MCAHIDAACFMVNVFRASKASEMPLSKLAFIQEKVSAEIEKQDAVIDWTRLSFEAALYYFASIFSETDEGTIRVDRIQLDRKFDFITDDIPVPVLQTLKNEIERVLV